MEALRQVEEWPCENVAVGVIGAAEATHGDAARRFEWASVTKLATAVAMLVAAEEGVVDLDEPVGPPGSTLRHLLAHTSGLPFEQGAPIARPGARRIYSNYGFEVAAAHVEERAEMPFAEYFAAVWAGTGAELHGSAGSGVSGTLADALELARELQSPTRLAAETLEEARTVQFPGVDGVLPGFGRQTPNDWGLGLELRDAKSPHWTGSRNSPRTYGHFGRSGTFLWVDPDAGVALACLTDRPFGDWAADAWPRFSGRGAVRTGHGLIGQELEQERVQLLGLVETDEVAGAGDDGEVCVRDLLGEVLGDGAEVRLVELTHHDQRRHRERRERRRLRPEHLRLLVRGLQLEGQPLLGTHFVAVLRRDPEIEVDLGRGVEIARIDRRLLG